MNIIENIINAISDFIALIVTIVVDYTITFFLLLILLALLSILYKPYSIIEKFILLIYTKYKIIKKLCFRRLNSNFNDFIFFIFMISYSIGYFGLYIFDYKVTLEESFWYYSILTSVYCYRDEEINFLYFLIYVFLCCVFYGIISYGFTPFFVESLRPYFKINIIFIFYSILNTLFYSYLYNFIKKLKQAKS